MLSDRLVEEMKHHLEDCEQSKMRHFDYSDICYEKKTYVNTANYVALGITLAWVLSTQFKEIIPTTHWLYSVFPVAIALVLAALNAIESKSGYAQQCSEHLSAAQRYHQLWRHCKNWKSDVDPENHVEFRDFVLKIRQRLNDINETSPHISIFKQKEIEKFRSRNAWKPRNSYSHDDKNQACLD